MNTRDPQSELPELIIEAGIVRLPRKVASGDDVYNPRMCLLVDHASGMALHFALAKPRQDAFPFLVDAINELVSRIGGWPQQIQMRDPQLSAALKGALAEAGAGEVQVVVRESLPMFDEAMQSMSGFVAPSGKKELGLVDVPGMTLDHIIAFAQAAREFYESRPWQHLIDDDLIEIQSPAGPPGTQLTQVLGAGGKVFGLGFVASRWAHEKIRNSGAFARGGVWSLLFGVLDDLPFGDGNLWEERNLAVAGPQAYPSFSKTTKSSVKHPSPVQLTWAEGLLRALAGTSEDEIDAGQWEKQVRTFSGPAVYRFSMPILLEQMSGAYRPDPLQIMRASPLIGESMMRALQKRLADQQKDGADPESIIESINRQQHGPEPTTPAEQAQSVCYKAFEARGRRQIQLARQALEIDPDCCDALLILAERATDPQQRLVLLRQAVEAGARQIGAEAFEQCAGHFWLMTETRPYMRARQSLALLLMDMEQFEEASDNLRDTLRLNPGDNQGNRYHLAQCLLHTNHLDELDELLNRSMYRDDFAPEWAFTKALLLYRKRANAAEVRRQLEEARKRNPHVLPLLAGKEEPPLCLPCSYSPGSEDEAIICFDQIVDGWDRTPGAIGLLETLTSSSSEKLARKWNRQREKKRRRK